MEVKAQPLIAVSDVMASSRWYQKLLNATGLKKGSDHDDVYDRIFSDGKLILQLHSWEDEEHPNLVDRGRGPAGHGVLLWFEVSDFDAAYQNAIDLDAEIIQPPGYNPHASHYECWLKDPDDYVVVIAGQNYRT